VLLAWSICIEGVTKGGKLSRKKRNEKKKDTTDGSYKELIIKKRAVGKCILVSPSSPFYYRLLFELVRLAGVPIPAFLATFTHDEEDKLDDETTGVRER
jgi:hypothetical protein